MANPPTPLPIRDVLSEGIDHQTWQFNSNPGNGGPKIIYMPSRQCTFGVQNLGSVRDYGHQVEFISVRGGLTQQFNIQLAAVAGHPGSWTSTFAFVDDPRANGWRYTVRVMGTVQGLATTVPFGIA